MNRNWIKTIEQVVDTDNFQFWSGITVWVERPNIVNRKLLAVEIIDSRTVSCATDKSYYNYLDQVACQYFKDNPLFCAELKKYVKNETSLVQCISKGSRKNCDKKLEFKIRKLIPRKIDKFSDVLDIVLLDDEKSTVTFWPRESDVLNSAITPAFPYRIKFLKKRIVIDAYKNEKINSSERASEAWLKVCVFPKLLKWCCNSPTSPILPSLKLVSVKKFSDYYNYLKGKYGRKYVQMWPECTDPIKYVYEDISIAAYLMTIWEQESNDLNLSSKQTFIDLGCGNGLLVDILSSEGYLGMGIDVRQRKIWNLYDERHTHLLEKTIEPSEYNIFPDFDWLIGNHSDELTPWIPVIAARSSYKMRVFLLPCCAYTFNGKYERLHSGRTQYQSYLSFIYTLCESMGFNVQEDKLRIPSTKRICFVCTSRNYEEKEEKSIDAKRQEFILRHLAKEKERDDKNSPSCPNNQNNQNCWIPNFKPRSNVEPVQNCTKLDRKFLEETVQYVANILLQTENFIYLQKNSTTLIWNAGGRINLGNLIKLMDRETLRCMKNQYGGFQTFLRNHKNVFQINDGVVQLTVPSKDSPSDDNLTNKRKDWKKRVYSFQEKPCFFFFYHPQGCPLDSVDCNFSHKIAKE